MLLNIYDNCLNTRKVSSDYLSYRISSKRKLQYDQKTSNVCNASTSYVSGLLCPKFFDLEVVEDVMWNANNPSTDGSDSNEEMNDPSNCTLEYDITPSTLRTNHHYVLWYINISNLLLTAFIPIGTLVYLCLLYTSPSPRDATLSRMPSSA